MLQGFYVSSGSDYREQARSLVGILTFALFFKVGVGVAMLVSLFH